MTQQAVVQTDGIVLVYGCNNGNHFAKIIDAIQKTKSFLSTGKFVFSIISFTFVMLKNIKRNGKIFTN